MSLDLLTERLGEAQASLLLAASPRELAQAISQEAGSPLLLADHPWLRQVAGSLPPALARQMQFAGETDTVAPTRVDTAVLVGLGAVPETGSVLVPGHTAASWRLSLCPRRLVVVIPASKAALTVAAALALTAQEPAALVSWLTGPSRTADIEKVLVLGAQGAAELTVIVYDPEHIVA